MKKLNVFSTIQNKVVKCNLIKTIIKVNQIQNSKVIKQDKTIPSVKKKAKDRSEFEEEIKEIY